MLLCVFYIVLCLLIFFFKQKTAYEMRISDWSSDVCSSDLVDRQARAFVLPALGGVGFAAGISLAGAFIAQCIGIAAVAIWAMAGTAIIALMLSVVTPARIGAREEAEGLDLARHGQQGWDFR